MEVLLFGSFLIAIIYFNNRIGKAEWRISELEGVLKKSTSTVGSEKPATPTASPDGPRESLALGAKESVAPSPAPAPQYASEANNVTSSIPTESKEETSARWLGRIGAIAVLLGVVFFLKYAFDNNWIGPVGRVSIGVLFGIVMAGLGQRIRTKYQNYSDILIACGVGVLYLSIYASYGFYHLVIPAVALFLMALVTAFALLIAVVDGSIGLAVFATLGGFATPVALSTGENHLVGLSLYMIILDLGVFGAAFYKKWLKLNVIAFIGTLFLFEGWMSTYYSEAQLAMTFLFGSVFFGLFLATSILHHLLRKEPTTVSDLLLITANAAWYFSLGYRLFDPLYHEYLGFFAFLLSALYLAIAYVSFSSNRADRTLNLFLPGIAVVFLTIAIPLQLTGLYISVAWLAEAVVLLATSLYLRERVMQVFAWLVLVLGIASVGDDVSAIRSGLHTWMPQPDAWQVPVPTLVPFWNTGFFLMFTVTLVIYLFAYLYHRFRDADPEAPHTMLLSLVLGSIATAVTFTVELDNGLDNWVALPWLFEGLLVLFIGLHLRSKLTQGVGWLVAALGLMAMGGAVGNIHQAHGESGSDAPAFFNLGTLLMLLSVGVTYVFAYLYRLHEESIPDWKKYAGVLVVIANLLTITCFTWEISYSYDLRIRALSYESARIQTETQNYYGGAAYPSYDSSLGVNSAPYYVEVKNIQSSKETAITIFWAFYAILLLIVGFAKRLRVVRLFGLAFFFVTAIRAFLIIWQLNELTRIISSIAFGIIALAGSFLYAKYKSRLQSIILD